MKTMANSEKHRDASSVARQIPGLESYRKLFAATEAQSCYAQ